MAKVTLTIEDNEEDGLTVRIESEPGWPGPAAEDQDLTPAQQKGLLLMEVLPIIIGGEASSFTLSGGDDEEPDQRTVIDLNAAKIEQLIILGILKSNKIYQFGDIKIKVLYNSYWGTPYAIEIVQ